MRIVRLAAPSAIAMLVGCTPTIAEVSPPPDDGDESSVTNRYTGPERVLWLVETREEGRVVAIADLEVAEGRRWVSTVAVPGEDVLDIRCMGDAAYVLGDGFVQRIPLASGDNRAWTAATSGVAHDLTLVGGRLFIAIRGEPSFLVASLEDGAWESEMGSEVLQAGVGLSAFFADGDETLALYADGRLERRDIDFVPTDVVLSEAIVGNRVLGLDTRAPVGFVERELFVIDQSDAVGALAIEPDSGDAVDIPLAGEFRVGALGPDGRSLWMLESADEGRRASGVIWNASDGTEDFAMQGGERGDWLTGWDLVVDAEGWVWTPLSYSPPDSFGSAIGRFDPSSGALRERWTTPWSQSDAVAGGPAILQACTPTP